MNWDEVNDAIASHDVKRLVTLLENNNNRNALVVDTSRDLSREDLDPVLNVPKDSGILCKLLSGLTWENQEDTFRATVLLLNLGCDPTIPDENGQTTLQILVKSRNNQPYVDDIINTLISFVVDESERSTYVNAIDAEGKSALYYTMISGGRIDRINKLLDLSADATFRDDETGATILHAFMGQESFNCTEALSALVTRLVELGCDPTAQDKSGQTPLHVLAKYNGSREVDILIDALISCVDESERSPLVNVLDMAGKSALFYSITCGFDSTRRINKLLDLSADPTIGASPTGPFFFHAFLGNRMMFMNGDELLQLITRLLNLGCDPKLQDTSDQTAIHVLLTSSNPFFAGRFLAMIMYTIISSVDVSERSSFINTTNIEGKSALYLAAEGFDSAVTVNWLLDFSADPFVGNPSESSVIHVFMRHTCDSDEALRAVTRLLELGCDPKLRDERGQTALHSLLEASRGIPFACLLEALISFVDESERSSFVNAIDGEGKSALFYAVECGTRSSARLLFTSGIKKLLDLSADPTIGDVPSTPMLHIFVSNIHRYHDDPLGTLIRLLNQGYNPNVQDQQGQSALHLLAKMKYADAVVSVLLQHGADPTITDNEGCPPLSYLGHAVTFDSTVAFLLLRHSVAAGC